MTEESEAIVRRIIRVAGIIESDSNQKSNQVRASEIITLAKLLTKDKK